jgi:hypothetical protein
MKMLARNATIRGLGLIAAPIMSSLLVAVPLMGK